jgi:hypothetical protein
VVERRTSHEEGSRAALNGLKNQAGAVAVLSGSTVPASSVLLYAPVLELVDRRDLHSRDPKGRPGSIPGWGTLFAALNRDTDNSTRCPRNQNRSAKRVNPAPVRRD